MGCLRVVDAPGMSVWMHFITVIHPTDWSEALLSAGHQGFRSTQARPSNDAPGAL